MIELVKGAKSMLEAADIRFSTGESVLIIADQEGGPIWLGQVITDVVSIMGATPILVTIPPRELEQREPPAPVAAAMKSANGIFCITDKEDLVHTNARKEATAAGILRFYGSLHHFDIDNLKRTVTSADIDLIKRRSEQVAERLTKADLVRVSTPSGTDITMGLKDRKALAIHPKWHVIMELPDFSEAAISPVEGTAEGIIVVDLWVVGWKHLLREPLRLSVKSGKVVDIIGKAEDVERLKRICATDEYASNIAELGIGLSHTVPGGLRAINRDKARLGTAHIAVGRNDDIGGLTWSAVHLDLLMDKITIELDGESIFKDGRLLI